MISYDDIRQLQQYPSGPDSCILSVYVNIDQSDAANLNRGFITQVENLCRQMADDASTSHRERFNEALSQIPLFQPFPQHFNGPVRLVLQSRFSGGWPCGRST